MNAELKTSLACRKASRVQLRYGGQRRRKYWYDLTLSGRLRPQRPHQPRLPAEVARGIRLPHAAESPLTVQRAGA